jgi:hypothetical protein
MAAKAVQVNEARRRRGWITAGWCTRREAEQLLGLKRAAVDNLRAKGVLYSERNPHTGAIRVSRESIELEIKRRSGA